ncbi:large ribosomal subunit protein mL49 [Neocloeon triangulifer]|uniref:large ribosomal subunit protein mL49 n=1 Tax=Neocloeon triangulifer TaxID=2078957 RepID=UPI00286F75F4|nr:large ribosomal subunit protein mL49 [Neocloeon triangulifer]XP_059484376.1 large ribosomal subunit protein mL49 [Neocloeon triangulifer]
MSLQVLSRSVVGLACKNARSAMRIQPARNSSYLGSKVVDPLKKYPDVEVVRNPPEWIFVERLFPRKTVPSPPSEETPSGWKPTKQEALSHPYSIGRSRNHMPSIYLVIRNRGFQKHTVIRHIKGDIWRLKEELNKRIEDRLDMKHGIHVNEMYGLIKIKGDVYNLVLELFNEKGF